MKAFECAGNYLKMIAGIHIDILPPLSCTQKFTIESKRANGDDLL